MSRLALALCLGLSALFSAPPVAQAGKCQADPCGALCSAGAKCDPASSQCVTDPACSGVLCKNRQGCFGGVCKDDPCYFITCRLLA